MYSGTLDRTSLSTDNQSMPTMVTLHGRGVGSLLMAGGLLLLSGCAGISSASKQSSVTSPSGQLSVSPAIMSFGSVSVGSTASQTGTLSASTADVAVSSAAWNGEGYSISGITFPVTVPSGQSVKYKVTFAPQSAWQCSGIDCLRQ